MPKPYIYFLNKDKEGIPGLMGYLNKQKENFNVEIISEPGKIKNDLLKNKERDIALFIVTDNSDKIPTLSFISELENLFPKSKKLFLTNTNHQEEVIEAFKKEILDCYVVQPYNPVDEKVIPIIEDLLSPWKLSDEAHYEPLKIIGPKWSPSLYNIKNFLSRNLYPYTFLDIENSQEAHEILKKHNIAPYNKAVVVFPDGNFMINPDTREIAEKAGLNLNPDSRFYDVIIIGAGPAGLAASVYAASEGLSTLVIEKDAPGGQAGCSSHIANYLGFPGGISGEELSKRAIAQAEKFGVEILRASDVSKITSKSNYKSVAINGDKEIYCYSIIICTGVSYKTLDIPGLDKFSGAGVYYGAVNTEAPLCEGKDIYIIGGGNSAGQAAMYLSHYAKWVRLVVLDESLSSTMSKYLIEQIENEENIEVLANSSVVEALGRQKIEKIKVRNNVTEEIKEYETSAIFIYIGAEPRTGWLPDTVLTDKEGFIITGNEVLKHEAENPKWPLEREPGLLETSIPGIYAAGDVRKGSVKRVASAVGEGAMAVTFIHQYISQYR